MQLVSRYQSLAFMVLCLLVAAALRLPDLPAAPPGLHYDEAANGVLSADIGLRGETPVFISSYTGKEVLFFYLAGGMMRLLGESVFALRLTAAFVGLLTVAATYWLGWELMHDRRVALIAAALVAVSFWHLIFSRLGFRAITQPLLQALTVAAIWRGMRVDPALHLRRQRLWLALAGVLLGLTAYTYLAARLFPILFIVAIQPLLFSPHRAWERWSQVTVVIAVGLVVAAPLLVYFIQNPAAFWVRIGQVAPGGGNSLGLGESYLKSLSMFFLAGDPYWRFNLPLRPLFDWFWGGLLVVGWGALLLRSRRLPQDWQRSAVIWLLFAPFIMILPTALATNEIVPSNLRAIGLIPFIFYLPAGGLLTLYHDLESRFRRVSATRLTLLTGMVLLLAGGLRTEQLYFDEWAGTTSLYYESDGDLAAIATFLDQTDLTGKTVYVAAPHYQHPTLAFLSRHYDRIKWLPQSRALVLPSSNSALYLFPRSSTVPTWMQPYLATAVRLDTIPDPADQPAFAAYEMPNPPPLDVPNPVNVDFGGTITLLGYEAGKGAASADVPLTLYWRIDSPPPGDFTPFVHLEDAWGHRWGQVETFAYPATQWQEGETIIQQLTIPVQPGAPPGTYRLQVGLFAQESGERLPRLDADGRYAGNTFVIENVTLTAAPPPATIPEPTVDLSRQVRDGLRLLGYQRSGYSIYTGDVVSIALWWLAQEPQPALTTRLELERAGQSGRILTNTQPVHGTYPFASWQTPIFLIDYTTARIPNDLPSGEYRLQLRILDAADETVLEADLGALLVTTTDRQFQPPATEFPLDATFGGEIRLLGYNLAPLAEEATLTLVWQAETEPTADYTVFVHLLNQEGGCCVWQADVMPQQNQYPTGRWQEEEVVVDTYQIPLPSDLPPGDYSLEVGLYIAENGRRLQVQQPGMADSDAVLLRPLTVNP